MPNQYVQTIDCSVQHVMHFIWLSFAHKTWNIFAYKMLNVLIVESVGNFVFVKSEYNITTVQEGWLSLSLAIVQRFNNAMNTSNKSYIEQKSKYPPIILKC